MRTVLYVYYVHIRCSEEEEVNLFLLVLYCRVCLSPTLGRTSLLVRIATAALGDGRGRRSLRRPRRRRRRLRCYNKR